MKKLFAFLLVLLLFAGQAHATQYPPALSLVSPYPGLTMLSNANSSFAALLSNNSGGSAPSYGVEGSLFTNTGSSLLEFYSGSSWFNIGYFGNGGWETISDGVPDDAVVSTGSANAYVVTYSPAPTALFTGHIYKFFTNFSNTSSATANFNTLGAVTLKKNGGTNLASGDLANNQFVSCAYDGTFCQVTSQLATSSSGGITSIATTSPVCGGTITTSGTLALCAQANNTVLANVSGSSAVPGATANPVATSWGIGATSAASGNMLHSSSTNTVSIATAGTDAVTVGSDQGVVVGSPTGGDEGSGSMNMASCFVNGVPCATGNTNGMVLLHTQICSSGSPCSTVTFNNSYFTSTYAAYKVKATNVYTSDGGSLIYETSDTNGSSWQASQQLASSTGTSLSFPLGVTMEVTGMVQSNSQPGFVWAVAGSRFGGDNYYNSGGGATANGLGNYAALGFFDGSGGTMVGVFSIWGYAQ